MPVVDLEGVAVGFQPMPATDEVKAKLVGYKNKKTKNNDDMITLEFIVDEPEEHAGFKLFSNQVIIPTGPKSNLHYLKEALINLGADPDDVNANKLDTDKILDGLLTSEVRLKVGVRSDAGRNFNDVTILPQEGW